MSTTTMRRDGETQAWTRRARPALGTLVEIGVASRGSGAEHSADDAIAAAFARIAIAEAQLSRFDPASAIHRFNVAAPGTVLAIGSDATCVLAAARELNQASAGTFDITLGSGTAGWHSEAGMLFKTEAGTTIDLGGIGKGHAVDCAVAALRAAGVEAGWVNAGGDLRVFGDLTLPVHLRDETGGGVRRFADLRGGAFATSRLPAGHASVAAEECLWADALTKLVVASGDARHPLLERYAAVAWLH